jgi:hypothetical protein
MIRTVIGGLVGGVILFLIGFVFWATPLSQMAYSDAGEAQSAAIQTSLAQNLTASGTGTYIIPNPRTAQGTVLYGKGPIAHVQFNASGFPVEDMSQLLTGFIFAIVAAMLMAFGLAAVAGARGFSDLARLVVLFSLGITVWTILAQPVFNHFGWGYWIYSFVAETTGLLVAGLVIARWFVPHHERAQPAHSEQARRPSEGWDSSESRH